MSSRWIKNVCWMSITSQKAEIIHLGGKWNHFGTRGNHGQFVFVIISLRKGKNLLYTIQNPETVS